MRCSWGSRVPAAECCGFGLVGDLLVKIPSCFLARKLPHFYFLRVSSVAKPAEMNRGLLVMGQCQCGSMFSHSTDDLEACARNPITGVLKESRSSCIAFSDLALKPHTILPATEASPHSVDGAGITSAWQVCPRICHCSLENYSLLTAV